MFMAASFTIANLWEKLKCPLKDEWIKKTLCVYAHIYIFIYTHIYKMEYYLALKKKSAKCNNMDEP